MDAPFPAPLSKKGNGGQEIAFPPARSFLRVGVGELYAVGTKKKTRKDIVTTGSAVAHVASARPAAVVAAAPDSASRDPARAVTPSGTPGCKNAGTNGHAGRGIVRSNLAAHTAASKKLGILKLGADPRAALPRQRSSLRKRRESTHFLGRQRRQPTRWRDRRRRELTPWRDRRRRQPTRSLPGQRRRPTRLPARPPPPAPAACATAADTAVLAPAAAGGPADDADTAGSPANDASAEPLPSTSHGNSALADASAKTAFHNPSADNAAVEKGSPLAAHRSDHHNDFGPRELVTPDGQVSERSVYFAPRRFFQADPYSLSLVVTLPNAPIPRSRQRAVSRDTARFCPA